MRSTKQPPRCNGRHPRPPLCASVDLEQGMVTRGLGSCCGNDQLLGSQRRLMRRERAGKGEGRGREGRGRKGRGRRWTERDKAQQQVRGPVLLLFLSDSAPLTRPLDGPALRSSSSSPAASLRRKLQERDEEISMLRGRLNELDPLLRERAGRAARQVRRQTPLFLPLLMVVAASGREPGARPRPRRET